MFAKLLKHEFRTSSKTLVILCLSILCLSPIAGIALNFILQSASNASSRSDTANSILMIFLGLFLLISFFAIIAFVVASQILLFVQFYQSKFTDEGYLTFTLPVTTNQILLSSTLNQFIWTMISFFVFALAGVIFFAVGCLFIVRYPSIQELWTGLTNGLWSLLRQLGGANIALAICNALVSIIMNIFLLDLSITVGSIISKKHKVLAAIGTYIGIHAVLSFITGGVQMSNLIVQGTTVNIGFESALAYTSGITLVLNIAITLLCYFLCHNMMHSKLNLP